MSSKKIEGSETYNHSKDVHSRRDASKQCLNKMHGRENAHMPVFLENFLIILGANAPPPPTCQCPPPLPPPWKEESWPPCQWPPFRERRILARAIGKAGGDGMGLGTPLGGELKRETTMQLVRRMDWRPPLLYAYHLVPANLKNH